MESIMDMESVMEAIFTNGLDLMCGPACQQLVYYPLQADGRATNYELVFRKRESCHSQFLREDISQLMSGTDEAKD